MGFAGSAEIFQVEMVILMASLEYVQAYIDDLLVITQGNLDDHLAKLEAVLIRLQDAGLKVNTAKLFFCTAETEYLGRLDCHKRGSKTTAGKGIGNSCYEYSQQC